MRRVLNYRYIFIVLFIHGLMKTPAVASLQAGKEDTGVSKNVVFVIDISNSMYDILPDLKTALKEYVKESNVGDSVSLVTFGKSAQLHYRKTMESPVDLVQILKFCDTINCPDEYTYIPCGLKKGIEELHQLYLVNPTEESILVLLSDGLNHPPDDTDQETLVTYKSIMEKFSPSFLPGKNWFITYVALKGKPDEGLFEFVKQCYGNTIQLGGKLLGGISEVEIQTDYTAREDSLLELGPARLPLKTKIPLTLMPIRGRPAGKKIKIESILTDDPLNSRLSLQIRPEEIIIPAKQTELDLEVIINGEWQGNIRGVLNFTPPDGSLLIIHPAYFLFRAKEPVRLIIGKLNPKTGDYDWNEPFSLSLGPLVKHGEVKEEKFVLKLDGLTSSEALDVRAIPDIKLPIGIQCQVEMDMAELLEKGIAEAIVRAVLTEDAQLQNKEWTGKLTFRSPNRELILPEEPIGLQVRTTVIKRKSDFLKWILISLFSILVTGVVAGGKILLDRRFIPAEGSLQVLDAPPNLKIEYIDLKQISTRAKKRKLILGNDKSADINIPHKSIEKHHALIRISRKVGVTSICLKNLGDGNIYVNNVVLNEEVRLSDRDIVQIGEFQFLYSNSTLKQVVVHYKDGDVKYGIPLSWNIEDKGFLLQPEKEAGSASMFIPFQDLKAVFFVKHFDKEIARKMKFSNIFAKKDYVKVTFKDGEKIKGYTIKDYNPQAPRFFLVPETVSGREENNLCILVERRCTKKVVVLKKADPGAENKNAVDSPSPVTG